MNKSWRVASQDYEKRLREAYHLEEAFDKRAFMANPEEYFNSINYTLQGIDKVSAIWNLLKFAKKDSNFLKGQLGPNGKRAKQIVLTLLSKNKDLKAEVDQARQEVPLLLKKYGNNLENILLKESLLLEGDRLYEGKFLHRLWNFCLVLMLLLAGLSLSSATYDIVRDNYKKTGTGNEISISQPAPETHKDQTQTKYGVVTTQTSNGDKGTLVTTESSGSVTGDMVINCNNIASVLIGLNNDVDQNIVEEVAKKYDLAVGSPFSTLSMAKKTKSMELKSKLINGKLTDADIQNICEAFNLEYYS